MRSRAEENLAYFLLLLTFTFLSAGCQSVPAQQRITRTYDHPPGHPLYALSVVDACIVAIDADKQEVAGVMKSPQFNASTDIVVTSDGELITTIDADAEHDYREILFLDPQKGKELDRVTVSWAPVTLGISSSDRLVVGHTLEKKSNGRFDLSVIDGKKKKLLDEIEVDGYVTDIAFDGDIAYAGLVAVRPDRRSGILAYDVQNMQTIDFHPIPQEPGQPPLSPASLAIDDAQHLYINLFQFDPNAPCQEKGRLVRMDLPSGDVTPMADLDDVGPIALLPQEGIIAGESCGEKQDKLILIDAETGAILQQSAIGRGVTDILPISQNEVAVSVFEDSAIIFFDTADWKETARIDLPCAWPEQLALR